MGKHFCEFVCVELCERLCVKGVLKVCVKGGAKICDFKICDYPMYISFATKLCLQWFHTFSCHDPNTF